VASVSTRKRLLEFVEWPYVERGALLISSVKAVTSLILSE
jgi:hypothetical protein